MPRVGLVLGAGGLAGMAFHAGALLALQEVVGFHADDAEVVVGTSAGSAMGAMLRLGAGPADLMRLVEGHGVAPGSPLEPFARTWDSLRALPELRLRSLVRVPPARAVGRVTRARRVQGGLSLAVAAAARPDGIPLGPYVQALREHAAGRWPERDLLLCAVHRTSGRRVVFRRHGRHGADLADAVAASSCIPGYFAPVEVGGRRYVDGGLHSTTNADVVAERRLDLVVVLAPMSTRRRDAVVSPELALRRYVRAVLDRELRSLDRLGTRLLVVNPGAREQRAMAGGLMDAARAATVAEVTHAVMTARLRRGRAPRGLRVFAA